jgi:protein TonB
MQRAPVQLALVMLCSVAWLAPAAPPERVVYLLEGHEVLHHEFPHYPQHAVDQRWEGSGILRLHVRRDGRVSAVTFIKSTGFETLDVAAREAFSRWRFRPEGGPFTADVPCDFRLRDSGGTRAIVHPTVPPKKT